MTHSSGSNFIAVQTDERFSSNLNMVTVNLDGNKTAKEHLLKRKMTPRLHENVTPLKSGVLYIVPVCKAINNILKRAHWYQTVIWIQAGTTIRAEVWANRPIRKENSAAQGIKGLQSARRCADLKPVSGGKVLLPRKPQANTLTC